MRKITRKTIKSLVIVLLILNTVTYVGARIYWYATGGVAAELQVVREADEGKVMNYFVAGNINQPGWAFGFLEDKIDGGIIYVDYAATRGCSIKQITNQVLADARQRNCRVRIFGISMGDYVGRFAEAELNNVETVAINPMPHASVLKPYANIGLKIVPPLMEGLTVPLGWISFIPLPCAKGFSFACLADQWCDIGYCYNAPYVTDHTIGVICSSDDEFLLNSAIESYFDGVKIVTIRAHHADTQGNAEAYAEAWDQLVAG